MNRCQTQKATLVTPSQEELMKKKGFVQVVVDKSTDVVVNMRADRAVQVGENNTMIVNLTSCRTSSGIGHGEIVESDMAAIASSRRKDKRPFLRLTKVPDQPIRVGRLSWNRVSSKNDHVFALKVDHLNDTDKHKSYVISPSVTHREGSKDSAANFQVEQLKSDVKGETLFVFRFHDRPAKLSVKFTLEALSTRVSSKNGQEVLDEVAVEINTVTRKTKRKKRDNNHKSHGSRGSDVCKSILPKARGLAPAAVTKESQGLSRISDQILKILHQARDDGCWGTFSALADKLSAKFPDRDSQIAIQLERSEAACYQGELDKAAGMLEEVCTQRRGGGRGNDGYLLYLALFQTRQTRIRRIHKNGGRAGEPGVEHENEAC